MSTVAAVVLFIGVIAYAVLGGADFGAGFWDLTAGGAESGRRPRHLVDLALAPVWEANHVWLIFCLVMLWSAFPTAFAAITTTLYIPLGLAALGIVVRGSGFAFRKVVIRTADQRAAGAAFASSSVITPFFLGTVAGGIASGRVPTGGYGEPITSWVNPTSILGGVLAVLTFAVMAAVFLVAEARRRDERDLEVYFRRRALAASAVTGVVVVSGIAVLHADVPRLFSELTTRGLVFVLASGLCGLAALVLLPRAAPALLRVLAVAAVAAVVAGWGVAQYPYLLGNHLTIDQAAAPVPTLWVLLVVAAVAVVVVAPSIGLLFVLQQRGRLEIDEA
jgi:cytochrome d ubiquinol oxidase subunit II